jgi:hypothetical protein
MLNRFILAVSLAASLPFAQPARADDPPADTTLAHDQAKAMSETVKHDVKVVAEAAKDGAKHATVTAKAVAHEVAVTTKEGAQEVAATAKRGAERARAAVNGEKTPDPPPKAAEKAPATQAPPAP